MSNAEVRKKRQSVAALKMMLRSGGVSEAVAERVNAVAHGGSRNWPAAQQVVAEERQQQEQSRQAAEQEVQQSVHHVHQQHAQHHLQQRQRRDHQQPEKNQMQEERHRQLQQAGQQERQQPHEQQAQQVAQQQQQQIVQPPSPPQQQQQQPLQEALPAQQQRQQQQPAQLPLAAQGQQQHLQPLLHQQGQQGAPHQQHQQQLLHPDDPPVGRTASEVPSGVQCWRRQEGPACQPERRPRHAPPAVAAAAAARPVQVSALGKRLQKLAPASNSQLRLVRLVDLLPLGQDLVGLMLWFYATGNGGWSRCVVTACSETSITVQVTKLRHARLYAWADCKKFLLAIWP